MKPSTSTSVSTSRSRCSHPELTHSTVVVERFLREARAAAAVKSPYICDVYDAGRLDDGRPFLVLELLVGESLYERMVKVRRFDVDFVARVFAQVSRGLTKAHEASIIHRGSQAGEHLHHEGRRWGGACQDRRLRACKVLRADRRRRGAATAHA